MKMYLISVFAITSGVFYGSAARMQLLHFGNGETASGFWGWVSGVAVVLAAFSLLIQAQQVVLKKLSTPPDISDKELMARLRKANAREEVAKAEAAARSAEIVVMTTDELGSYPSGTKEFEEYKRRQNLT